MKSNPTVREARGITTAVGTTIRIGFALDTGVVKAEGCIGGTLRIEDALEAASLLAADWCRCGTVGPRSALNAVNPIWAAIGRVGGRAAVLPRGAHTLNEVNIHE